ncbi:uncharacterized protein M6B38_310100 [Iris pallida]|uniref:Uncharacterized protein n=1 Tax=Iris pallida TaxID=29817 RepID=A0AAX6HHM2_IRIPA|nr:uncharacterized protein M6B38_310100 [Iris pallida]
MSIITTPLPLLSLPPKLPACRHFRLRQWRCSSSSEERDPSLSGNEKVSAMVDELLKREENRGLLDGLEAASQRVERAREALANIERQEAEAMRAKSAVARLEKRKSEIEESQRELLEARAMVEEAEHSLSLNMEDNNLGDAPDQQRNKDLERIESVKAASISAIVGTLASLPISFYQNTSYVELILDLAIIFISCTLFGVTFRYAVRRDLDNIQLKTGTPAAFGFVKGLAALGAGMPLELNMNSLISHSIDGSVCVAENIFIFLSASVALDFCFKMKLLSPFPIRKVE